MSDHSSKKIEPRRLKGFRDYLPEQMETRSRFQQEIRLQAKLAGFREVGTPALEYLETLLGQGSEETDKQVYRFEDHGARQVGLRFDLTIPFARFVAEHQGELTFPFKRLQIGDVWRGENTQKGRYREFCQCDIDVIGVDSVNADVDVIACIYSILARFNLGGFTMRLGSRVLLSALLVKAFPTITTDEQTKALIALDKLDKIGADAVAKLLCEHSYATLDSATMLLDILSSKDSQGGTDQARVATFLNGHENATAELRRIQSILEIMAKVSQTIPGGTVKLDLSIARGLGYYTGVVFETTLDRLPGFGSISSGGRYDNLAERFTSRHLPGVGGSIGLDRLLAGLDEMSTRSESAAGHVFIAVATPDALSYAVEIATTLKAANITAEFGLTTGKLGQQFKHADRLGCPYVVTVGTDEVASMVYSLKNMKTGEESKQLPIKTIVESLSALR